MVRPRKNRLVLGTPPVEFFKPRGIPMKRLTETCLPVEGYEALRLADVEGLNQEEAARKMGVSRHTFGRVLSGARQTVSRAIVAGWALRIEGGDYRLAGEQNEAAADSRSTNLSSAPQPGAEILKVEQMSKIAISSEGPNLSDQVDPRFGRAAGFLIVDQDNDEHSFVENGQNQVRNQGAGIGTAELMAQNGVAVVLTGFVGPKAFQALNAAGIKVGQNLEGMSASEALQRFNDGQVELATGPNR